MAGCRLTSAALSTNRRSRRGDVSRLTVANFRGEVDRLVHDYQPRRLVSPSRSLVPSLSLPPLALSLPLARSLARARARSSVRPSRSHAHTHALSRSVLSATSSNLYFRLDRELGANWSKRARPPRFFNRPHGKLTTSGYRHRRRRRAGRATSYIRATVCARAAAPVGPSESRRDDACLNLNTLW